MIKIQMTPELTDLSNKLIIATTKEATGVAVDLSKVIPLNVAASMVARTHLAAAIGVMMTISHAAGGEIDRDAIRATVEELLSMQATPIEDSPDGEVVTPITQH